VNLVSVGLYGTLVSWLEHFKLDAMLGELVLQNMPIIQLYEFLSAEPHRLDVRVLLLKVF